MLEQKLLIRIGKGKNTRYLKNPNGESDGQTSLLILQTEKAAVRHTGQAGKEGGGPVGIKDPVIGSLFKDVGIFIIPGSQNQKLPIYGVLASQLKTDQGRHGEAKVPVI
jgi:hypothetical protein